MTDTRAVPQAATKARGAVPPPAEMTALAATIGLATFPPLVAVVMALTTPVELRALNYAENQHAESALYALTFVVALPLALVGAERLGRFLWSRLSPAEASAFCAALCGGLAALLLVTRIAPAGDAVAAAVIADVVWAAAALLVLRRVASGAGLPRLLASPRLAAWGWPAVGVLVVAGLLAFTTIASISLLGLALGAVLAALLVRSARSPRRPARGRRGFDVAFVVLLALVIPDLVVFAPPVESPSLDAAFATHIAQFHQDFFLGPVDAVLHGGAMLVDVASQYGVGSIYALAGWFQLAPLGYGPLAFLDGCLYVLYFAAGYAILRLAGVRRGLAALAVGLAVVVLLYNLVYPVGALLQHGPLRFGIPMLVVLGAVAEARGRWAGLALGLQLLAVGLASIWALEAFAFTGATFLAVRAFARWSGATRPLAALGRDVGLAALACVGFHIAFALLTLAFSGSFPDWGDYLAFLHQFLVGNLGDLTYDFSPWSAGLVAGAGAFTSAAGFVLLVRSRPDLVTEERPRLAAICGTTAFGIVLFSYFVDRSADHILPYVSFPVVLSGTLWLSLILGRQASARVVRWTAALAAAAAVLATSVAWSSIGPRFSDSPLGELAPGGSTLGAAFHRLWHLPALDDQTPQGEALLTRYMPGVERVPVVLGSDLQDEVLIRTGRVDSIPFTDPLEDSFVGSRLLGGLGAAVDGLQPGQRVLVSRSALGVLDAARSDPGRDLFADPIPTPDALTDQQEWVLGRLALRYRYRVVHRDADYAVLELGRLRARAST